MAFKLENFGAEVANAKSTLGGICYYRYFNEENNTLTTAGYFPATLGLEVGDRIRVIPSVKTDADEIYIVTSTANRTVTVKQIDTDGAVDSVNGKTGTVVLTAEDVNATPQLTTMPTASSSNIGDIVQFIGTTDANYTNGYFYKCTGVGEPVVYSWTQIDVQPAPDPLPSQTGNNGKFLSTNGTTASWETVGGLPDQTGNAGKFLTTDGTDASWGTISALQNKATHPNDALTLLGTATTTYSSVNIGALSTATSEYSVAIGHSAGCSTQDYGTAIGQSSACSGRRGVAIGAGAIASALGAIQIGKGTNSTQKTVCFGIMTDNYTSVNYEIMSADGTIPAARHASLPSADGTYVLKLVISSGVPTLSWVAE